MKKKPEKELTGSARLRSDPIPAPLDRRGLLFQGVRAGGVQEARSAPVTIDGGSTNPANVTILPGKRRESSQSLTTPSRGGAGHLNEVDAPRRQPAGTH